MARKVDDNQDYVLRSGGNVVANNGNCEFRSGVEMKPSDTVVVPLKTERMSTLLLWQIVTQIIYNVTIAAAAIKSF